MLVTAAVLSLIVVVEWVLAVPLAGSLALFTVGAALYLFSITSLSIMIATEVNSMPQFGLLAFPVFMILYLLSGSTTPMESMLELLGFGLFVWFKEYQAAAEPISLAMVDWRAAKSAAARRWPRWVSR